LQELFLLAFIICDIFRMGRPKKFNREDLLDKAVVVFWKKGFAGTTLHDLEKATKVNKSGLYSEFKDKEDLYLTSLQHYTSKLVATSPLSVKPLGWNNIERFFEHALTSSNPHKGCFCVNTMRELPSLPLEVNDMVEKTVAGLKAGLTMNIAAERTKMAPESIADLVLMYFLGACIEQNLDTAEKNSTRKVSDFMRLVRSL
jgi:AcrR family transcriptional regulator